MKLTKPYKNASPSLISQGFSTSHKALDMVTKNRALTYGTPLTAPEKAIVVRSVGDTYTPGKTDNLAHGYGVVLQGLETGYFHLFWHTLPTMPVKEGDVVERGKIVAFMGNAGTVKVDGVLVPVADRLEPCKPGTHLHWEVMERISTRTWTKVGLTDPAAMIDWSLEPTYTLLDLAAASATVAAKITKLISK